LSEHRAAPASITTFSLPRRPALRGSFRVDLFLLLTGAARHRLASRAGCQRHHAVPCPAKRRPTLGRAISLPSAVYSPQDPTRTCHGVCAWTGCVRRLAGQKSLLVPRRYQPFSPHHAATIAAHASRMRLAPSPSEQLLWSQLAGSKLGVAFRRQYVVGRFVADFAAPSPRLHGVC
jgi:hypothetical protein